MGQEGVAAHLFRPHDERSLSVDGAGHDGDAGDFLDGQGLAGDHRLVHVTAPFHDAAVNGYPFAGLHAEQRVGLNPAERDVHLLTVLHSVGDCRGKAEEGPDGVSRAAPGPEFQDLAQQDQNGDDRGGFEIDGRFVSGILERPEPQFGDEDGGGAVEKGCCDSQRDQREHVQLPCAE